jgi:hypothetical protein
VTPAELQQQLVTRMASFRRDPLGYVLYAFPWGVKGTDLENKPGPRAWQRKKLERIGTKLRAGALNNFADVIREATCSGHGPGKSAFVAWLVKWGLDTRRDTKVVVTANTEKQLQTKTWPELAKWHRLSITAAWFVFTATALYSADPKHEKTWRGDAIPWSEHNTEAFAGLHNEGKRIVVIFDEASKIADKVWEVTEGTLTDANTEILWFVFGNGTRATGRFRECFRQLRHRWECENIDSRTVEGTNTAQLQQWVEDYGEDSDFVKVRVRGMFPAASLKQFISETDVDQAWGKQLKPEQYQFAPVILTCDPAWEGDDPLVIGKRQGLKFEILRVLPKNDNDVWVANLMAQLEDEHGADAVFVDAGYGTGIVSAAMTMGRDWQLVWFAESPIDPGYLNKRAEMWGGSKSFLKGGGSLDPRYPQLRDDLTGPETVARLDGKIQLEAKKDMKARGLPSPNFGDVLALSFAYPVVKRQHDVIGAGAPGTRGHAIDDWDPLA